jgi:hypothetical protein
MRPPACLRRNDGKLDVGRRDAGNGGSLELRLQGHPRQYRRHLRPQHKGHVGSREKTTTAFSRTYHYERLGWTGKPEADIIMECIEYQLTAP